MLRRMRAPWKARSPFAALIGALLVASATSAEPERAWCAPELEVVADGVCFFSPEPQGGAPETAPTTLVLFLHSLVAVHSDWQWKQQLQVVRAAQKHGFALLMPRGRAGIGPGRAPDVWAWPTSPRAQEAVEDELIQEWEAARDAVERRRGARFERLLVFGFSNGAYYASSLAFRDRIPADGYGVFAGGAGGRYAMLLGARTERRAPMFVGYGTKDPARKDMGGLLGTLKRLGWPHGSRVEHVGHVVTDSQLALAIRFLEAKTSELATSNPQTR